MTPCTVDIEGNICSQSKLKFWHVHTGFILLPQQLLLGTTVQVTIANSLANTCIYSIQQAALSFSWCFWSPAEFSANIHILSALFLVTPEKISVSLAANPRKMFISNLLFCIQFVLFRVFSFSGLMTAVNVYYNYTPNVFSV